MRFIRSIIARFRAWRAGRRPAAVFDEALVFSFGPTLYRDVTPRGVRVYSLCGGCGTRLECSATLCEECAQGPHTTMS
jgi:hypothetical protein